jgi:hypothetical protein
MAGNVMVYLGFPLTFLRRKRCYSLFPSSASATNPNKAWTHLMCDNCQSPTKAKSISFAISCVVLGKWYRSAPLVICNPKRPLHR